MALGTGLTVRVPRRDASGQSHYPSCLPVSGQTGSSLLKCVAHTPQLPGARQVMGGQKMNRTGLAPALKELRIYWYVEGMGGLK